MTRSISGTAFVRGAMLAGFAAALAIIPTSAGAQAQIVDFGVPGLLNCSGAGFFSAIPSGDDRFGNLSFTGFNPGQRGLVNLGTANCVGTNRSNRNSSIGLEGGFVFNSVLFGRSIAGPDVSLTLTGLFGGSQVFQEMFTVSSFDLVLFTPESMMRIDRLEFAASGGGATGPQFQIDNFTFTTANMATVPEPGSALLLSMGLVGLLAGAMRRRREA